MGEKESAVSAVVETFVGDDSGRSVALRSLRGDAVEFQLNADVERPAASILKLPLAVAVLEAAQDGGLQRRAVRVVELPPTTYPTLLAVFDGDHELTIEEACGFMLATSDNPLADFLLELVGLDAVNDQALRLGAEATRLRVGFADGELGDVGRANTSTASDSVQMIVSAVQLPHAGTLLGRALRNNLRNMRIPLRLPDETPVAHKTGTLKLTANDAGVIYGHNTDLAVAFLCDNQADTAWTSIEIGDCVAKIWQALGEPTGDQQ